MKTLDDLLAENARLTEQVANLTAELTAEKAKATAPKPQPAPASANTAPRSWKDDAKAHFNKTAN